MYDLPKNTLSIYLANPMLDNVDFSKVPVKELGNEIDSFKKTNKMAHPETDALMFYMLNHGFHLIKSKYTPLEPLPKEIGELVEQHLIKTSEIAKRLFYYIVMICVEEGRFIRDDADFDELIEKRYGKEFIDYIHNDFSVKGDRSLTSFKHLNMDAGDFLAGMVSVFGFGSWSPGYGGRGWVGIAQLASDLTTGGHSFERMADNAFSLCHNNGSMFNKGHLYSCYTSFIYEILDIQDSGQIPKWVGSNTKSSYVTSELREMHQKFFKFFPEEFGGGVDQKLIKDSSQKRQEKEAKKAQQLQKIWANQGWGGNNKREKAPPTSKIDELVTDAFKKNNWIK